MTIRQACFRFTAFVVTGWICFLTGAEVRAEPIDSIEYRQLNPELVSHALRNLNTQSAIASNTRETWVSGKIDQATNRILQILRPFDKQRLQLAYQACTTYQATNRIHILDEHATNMIARELGLNATQAKVFQIAVRRDKGFFLPQLGRIFIQDSTNLQEVEDSLVHECIHAYQYHYRLPIDVSALPNLDANERVAVLSYYYETEAHWLTQKYHLPDSWTALADRMPVPDSMCARTTFFNALTFGLVTAAHRASDRGSFAKPDQVPLGSSGCMGVHDGVSVNYWYTMPVSDNRLSKSFVWTSEINFEFHRVFLASLQKAQFGEQMPYLFDPDEFDRNVFNKLTTNFYEKIDSVRFLANSKEMSKLAKDLLLESKGVLEIWEHPTARKVLQTSVEGAQIELLDQYRADYLNRIQEQRARIDQLLVDLRAHPNQRALKTLLNSSGEGSNPNLNFAVDLDESELDSSNLQKIIESLGLSFIELQPRINLTPDAELIKKFMQHQKDQINDTK